MTQRNFRIGWAIVMVAALLGTAPSVFGSGSNASGAAISTVVMNHTPVPGDEFYLYEYANVTPIPAPTGTTGSAWASVCTSNNATVWKRAVVAADNSTTLTPLAVATANVALAVEEVANDNTVDVCKTGQATGTPPAAVTLAGSTIYNADTGLCFAVAYFTGTSLTTPSPTQCAGFSTDTSSNQGGASGPKVSAIAGNLANIPVTFSYAPAFSGTGTITSGKTTAAFVGIQNGNPWCLGNLLLLGVGC